MAQKINSNERFSLARPNGDSTKNGTFQWDQKEFHNSSNSQGHRNMSLTRNGNTNGLSKIDARVFTDVQSRGLTSRVVRYHENNTRLNRSMSLTNLSIKSSPLSVKHPSKQPELPYKAVKQNISMTHIAPPDKSLYYGNTLSGLLRSSSVLTLQQNDDDLSSENRPIIHPPGTEKEFQPSVLEVLKEISRKRINNDVLQDNDESDTSKKYCSRGDTIFNGIPNEYRLQQMQTQPPTYKRQRESNAYLLDSSMQHTKQQQQQSELSSPEQQSKRRHCNYNNDITSSLSSSAKSTANKRKLNEHDGYIRQEKCLRYQPADIRLCELSSALNYNKSPITPLPNTPQTTSNDLHLPTVFVQKSISAPVRSANTNIEAQTKTEKKCIDTKKPRITLFNRNYDTEDVNKLETTSPSSTTTTLDNDEDNAYAGIHFVKPKKSTTSIGASTSNLVLQRTQKSKLALMLSGLRGELYLGGEENEENDKQKNINESKKEESKIVNSPTPTANSSTATSNIMTTPLTLTNNTDEQNRQQTTSNDKIDAGKVANIMTTNNLTQLSTATTTINTTNIISTTSTTPTASIKPSTKITSPLCGIKLTPMTTTAAATTTTPPQQTNETIKLVVPTLNFTTPASTSNVVAPVVSTASFSFGLPKPNASTSITLPSTSLTPNATTDKTSSTLTPTTSTLALPSSTLNFNFGTKNNASLQAPVAISITAPTTTTATTSASLSTSNSQSLTTPAFNFGAKPQANNSGNATNTFSTNVNNNGTPTFTFGSQPAPIANKPAENTNPANNTLATPSFNFTSNKSVGGFNFGATTTTAATMPTPNTNTFAAPQMSSGGFTFGSNTNLGTNTVAVAAIKTTNPIISFGSNTSAPLQFGAQQPENKSTTAANSLLFGSKPKEQPQQQAAAQNSSLFNLAASTVATATTSNEAAKTNSTFNFTNTVAQAKTFSFGASNGAVPNTETPKTTNLFGSVANNNNQNQAFSFGSVNTNTANSTVIPNKSAFSFGGSNNSNTTTATTTMEAPKQQTNTFSFSNTNQSNTFGVGTNATQNNAFTFGGATTDKPATTESTTANIFGGAQKSSGPFSFGSKPQAINSTFGTASLAAPTNNSLFNFGNSNTTATKTIEQTSNKSTSGNFGTFGSNATATATPTFGTAANNTGPSGGFVFGASSTNNAAQAPSSGNIFAASNQVNPAPTPITGNLFGSTTNTQASGNAFVFGAAASASAPANNSTPAPNSNLFSVQPNAGAERPIRRATRRLAKS